MNRDIEFRTYIKNENIMINVPIIDFRKSAKCIRTVCGQTNASEWKYKFDDIILMQYTGLKDKNGKKIFEGDIVKYDNDYIKQIGVIEWNDKNSSFQIKGISSSSMTHLKRMIVIGNIYENKELLEG